MTPVSMELILSAISIAFFSLAMFLLAKGSNRQDRIELRSAKNGELIENVRTAQGITHDKLFQVELYVGTMSKDLATVIERVEGTRNRLDRIEDKLDTAIGNMK